MKQFTNHAIALLCAVMFVAALLGGCTAGTPAAAQTQAPTAAPAETTQSTEAPAPAAQTGFGNGATLELACLEGWDPAVTLADNLPIWQEFEKRTGVKIKWNVHSDYDTAMQPVVASGQNLPDILLVPPTWNNSGVFKLATDGVIIPLDDLISKDAPDITKLLGSDPDLKALLTAPDGKIYTIADTPKYVNSMVASSFFIRQDWLDKIGQKAPTTTDEWYNVLKAFKATDLNGNGQADELPISGIGSASISGFYNTLSYFGSAFGLTSPTCNWWYDSNGKVFCQYASQEYKNLLTFCNKLYSEGLVDKEPVRDEPNFQSLTSTNVVGSFATLCGYLTLYDNLLSKAGVADGKYTLVAPPSGSNGLKLLKRDPTWNHYGITRDCKIPDIAIKWMNYVWGSDDGVRLNDFGIEGKTYTIGSDGKPHFTDYVLKNPDGLDPYNALRVLGASDTMMIRTPMDVYIEMQSGFPNLQFEQSMVPNRVDPFPQVMNTTDEQSVIDTYEPDFNTYVTEMQLKFITGAEPLSNFDAYVTTLNKMGMDKLLTVYQGKYNRAKGIK
jgi:putative aldouronate transport system substrate-binding protein